MLSRVKYLGTGTQQLFAFQFPLLNPADLIVTVDGVVQVRNNHYVQNTSSVVFNVPPPIGKEVRLTRKTSQENRLVNYQDGVPVGATTLNRDSIQAFYMAQEALDAAEDARALALAGSDNADIIQEALQAANQAVAAAAAAQAAAAQIYGLDQELEGLAQRIAVLETGGGGGSTPVPTPPPVGGGSGPDYTFVLDDVSLPAGFAVTRSGDVATRTKSDGSLEIVAANTPRVQHSASGTRLGVLIEDARTNHITHGKTPGVGGTWSKTRGDITVTPAAGIAPDGTNTAVRVQIPAGTAYNGVRFQLFSQTAGQRRMGFYAKSYNANTYPIMYRNLLEDGSNGYDEVGPSWQFISDSRHWTAPGNFFNFDIMADVDGADLLVWGAEFAKDSDSADTLVVTNGGTQTRGKEAFVLDVVDGTWDVRVTFNDDTTQNLLALAATSDKLTIEAPLNKRIVKKIEVFPEGDLGDGGSSPPPPPPPPPAGLVWTPDEVDYAVRTATGLNEGQIGNVDPNQGGWKRGAGIGFGRRWMSNPMPSSWSWPLGGRDPNDYWTWFYWWGVLFTELGNNTSDGWVEIKDQEWQVLYEGDTQWRRPQPKSSQLGWGSVFAADMITDTGVAVQMRQGLDGGFCLRMPHTGSPHWTAGLPAYNVPNPDKMVGFLTTCLVRLDPRGDPNAKALVHVGGDAKPTNQGNAADGVPWYPGHAVSAAMRVTPEWKRITACAMTGMVQSVESSQQFRLMPQSTFRSIPPLR